MGRGQEGRLKDGGLWGKLQVELVLSPHCLLASAVPASFGVGEFLTEEETESEGR